MQPRLIRLRDAPKYVGMDRHRFNKEVRPTLHEISIGKQGIAFDRLDLDAWVDHYMQLSGRLVERRFSWDVKERQESTNDLESGTSTNNSEAPAFARALEQATSGKARSISRNG